MCGGGNAGCKRLSVALSVSGEVSAEARPRTVMKMIVDSVLERVEVRAGPEPAAKLIYIRDEPNGSGCSLESSGTSVPISQNADTSLEEKTQRTRVRCNAHDPD